MAEAKPHFDLFLGNDLDEIFKDISCTQLLQLLTQELVKTGVVTILGAGFLIVVIGLLYQELYTETEETPPHGVKNHTESLVSGTEKQQGGQQKLSLRSDKCFKLESRKDIRIKNSTNRSSGSESEPKLSEKPNPEGNSVGQRNNSSSGAIPKVNSSKHKKQEKRTRNAFKEHDKRVNINDNRRDEHELKEYFVAVESVTEGVDEYRKTVQKSHRKGFKSRFSSDQSLDNSGINKGDRTLRQSTVETLDQFVDHIKTMAEKMKRNIDRLIEEARVALENTDLRQARRKAMEAMVGAQEAKDHFLLLNNALIREIDLADWFGQCAFILDKTGDIIISAKCFYTATVFDSNWTEKNHSAVSIVLWNKIFSELSSPERVIDLLHEMEKLTKLAELRSRWKVCIAICHDALRWTDFLKSFGFVTASPLSKARRLALAYFKLGEHKAAQTYCMIILRDLTDFDDLAAFEIWARSLFSEEKFDVALTKVDLGLGCAKIPEDKERLNALKSEIQASIPAPQENHEPDPTWLSGTSVDSQSTLKKASSVPNLTAGKSSRSKTRHRRPKARDRSKCESNTPSPVESVNSSRAPSPDSSQNTMTTIYRRKKRQEKELNQVDTSLNTGSGKGYQSRDSSLSTTGDCSFFNGHLGPFNDISDSESDENDNNEIPFTTSKPDEEILENASDELSFYEQTFRKFNGRRESFFSCENEDDEADEDDEKMMTSGVILNQSYMHRFREKTGTPFYKPLLQGEVLLQQPRRRPDIYKRCVLQIDGSHVSYCYPIDSNDSGLVIEISGRSKAGQTYNEDEVVVELLDKVHESKDRRYGKVIGIVNRQRFKDVTHPVFLCTLDDMDSHLVRPLCKTVPKIHILNRKVEKKYPNKARYKMEIYTYDRASQTLSDDPKFININPGERDTYLFLVVLIKWSPRSTYPLGAVIKRLKCGENIQQGLTVLDLKHKVPALYKRNTYDCVEGLMARYQREKVLINESSDREDLCDIRTFTIDPPGSQDLDDALSIERTEDGFKVGVHIADVSAVVRKGDPIDLEAYERAVTYYPTIRRPRNMLPEPLSSNLCSLLPNQQRRAISVFFLLDRNGKLLQIVGKTVKIVRSVIMSRQKFTYREVQDIINDPEKNNHPLKNDIMMLFDLAKKIRRRRLGDAMFALDIENDEDISEDSLTETLEAHYLVEEFMIMANQKIAETLAKKFSSCTPIRSQPPPTKDNMESFLKNECEYVDALVRLQGKKMGGGKIPSVERIRADNSKKNIMISKVLWETFANEPGKAMRFLMIDDLYPIQHIVYQHWIAIQERAEYQCTGGTKDLRLKKHFSLDMYPYTHFTSPIRRYIDLVVHRLLIAALEGSQSPYSKTEIDQICVHVNAAMRRAKEYQRGCRTLENAIKLKSNPQMIHCFVDEATDRSVTLCSPEMKYMDKQSRQLAFNLLDMRRKPKVIQDTTTGYGKIEASWRKRIYDKTGVSSTPNSRGNLQTLHSNPGFLAVPLHTWARMLTCALENRQNDLKRTIKGAFVSSSDNGVDDVSTESINPIDIQPYTEFSLTFSPGQSLKGQMSCAPRKGCLCPQLVLYNMTNNVKLCLQHTDDPVLHLCRYSTKPTSSEYSNAKEYVNTWLPIMTMEAAVGAVSNEECFIINNVAVKFDGERTGRFSLSLAYCEIRNIDFSGIDDEEEKSNEPRAYDWLCLKFTSTSENQATTDVNQMGMLKLKTVWVGHAEIISVKKKVLAEKTKDNAADGKLTVSFHLHEKCPTVPMEARQKKRKFSVEVLCKSEVDRRTEKFLKTLEGAEQESVSMKIALNIGRMPGLEPGHANLAGLIERDFVVGSGDNVRLPPNNKKQQEAIDKALTERFSLIQGPPGTGKSYTGIKLMCLFDQINSMKHKGGGKRHKVLFCGPSNKSVDLIARWMLQKLGDKMPKFLRVYGRTIEAMDFPIPGRTFLSRKSMHNLKADEQLRSVSLHHLIRVKGEKNAEEITALDRKFAANKYAPDPYNVKKYVHLIREASIEMIRKYDVILCTTAVGSNPKVLEASNIFQVIVDEAGMCPEPHCLVPVLATKAEQVVLIGDHKQLRPIIKCKEAALLGLNKSLFERYADSNRIPLTMLEWQYRMNTQICRFPSKKFYSGKLITKPGFWCKDTIDIWPTERDARGNITQYPHVLVHVEGEEKVLTVSTDEGNEQSKSNQEEIEIVVNVYKYLIEDQGLSAAQINVMSQYNAQVSEIKKRLCDEKLQNFTVSTVVSSQGGEWDYVIFSTVRSLPVYKIEEKPTKGWCQQNLGFITDQNQINVALTRARKGLIIVGNKTLLQCDEVWKDVISDYETKGCIKTPTEFPPPKVPRWKRMQRQMQRTRERYGDSMFEPGTATSYEGPVDDDGWTRVRGNRRGNADR